MTDLSVIIPARNEEFLQLTIDDILANMRADTEVLAVLDGYWPAEGLPIDPRVHVIHHETSIGQRAAVNEGAKVSGAKYIMKVDAHCAFDEGFDEKLMADCEYDWTVIPRMYNLHAFDWECEQCGRRWMQGPLPPACDECDNKTDFKKQIVWHPKLRKRSDFARFDTNMKFQYWRAFEKRPESKGDITDMMCSVGACFFMHRARFWDLGGLDEAHGSWGQMGVEVACKAWLSGGRQVVNKKTWFSHLFRTQSGFGFPYKISGRQVGAARKHSKNLWLNDKWPKAVHKLQWLLDRFAPVPEWHEDPAGGPVEVAPPPADAVAPVMSAEDVAERLVKGLVYYTDNRCEERITNIVRRQLENISNGRPIVSVSQYPIAFGSNVVMPLPRGPLTMFKQILAGLQAITADVVFLVEHDVIYHLSHFDFTPPKTDVFYYNENTYKVDAKSGQALFYYTKQTSGLCAYRDLLIEHYERRVARVEKEGFTRRMGFEPGTHRFPRGVDDYRSERYMSGFPNIDVRHASNLTANRFKKEQYRSQRSIKGWKMCDDVPGWGRTKGRFDEFLYELSNG
jgi:hypothetical protein